MLRTPRLDDVPELFEIMGDAQAMRYTQADVSMRSCRRRVAVHEWFRRRNGYAPWTVVDKADRRIIGWGGLYDDPFDPGWGVEVAYFFHPSTWGKGYASELVQTCMDMADNQLGLAQVHAFAHPDNARSRRVLEKSGFEIVRFVAEMDRWLYLRQRQSLT